EINNLSNIYSNGKYRLRLTVDQNGKNDMTTSQLVETTKQRVVLADEPIDQNHLYLYNKTTHRTYYNVHQVNDETILDVLLWNDNQEITEFTIGNIVIELDGALMTPPASSGLLAGTFRNKLIDDGYI